MRLRKSSVHAVIDSSNMLVVQRQPVARRESRMRDAS